jgi:hypothetical protein
MEVGAEVLEVFVVGVSLAGSACLEQDTKPKQAAEMSVIINKDFIYLRK